MSSVWIRERRTKAGASRYLVEFKLGGRETKNRHGGSFRTKRLATIRAGEIDRDLAALRVPELRLERRAEPVHAPTLREAADRWRASRVDVAESTRVLHRVALDRALRTLGETRIDEIAPADVAALVATLSAGGSKRETIRKTVKYLAAVLDDAGVVPNPARDRRIRLPHEEREELVPPSAKHVREVCRLLPSAYRLPLLWLDWSGARVASVDKLLVSDYDEPRRRVRLRASTVKSRQALWFELPEALSGPLEAALGPREDRDPDGGCSLARARTGYGPR